MSSRSNPLTQLAKLLDAHAVLETPHAEYLELSPESIFDEEPVDLDTYLYDSKFLKLPVLSSIQYQTVYYGSMIYYQQTIDSLGWSYDRFVNTIVAMWGKGSGKDTIARILLSRIVYLLLCLKEPQRYLNKMPDDPINTLNVAYSGSQALNIFFEPLKTMLGRTPWFRNKFNPTENIVKFEKNIQLHSGHSDQESLEGHNLIAGVLDEFGAFKTKMELEKRQRRAVRPLQHSAEGIAEMITESSRSRFAENYKIVYISYPRYRGDAIMQKVEEFKNDPKAFVSVGATWEINPTVKRENLQAAYNKNPERARAIYEANPPLAIEAYFKRFGEDLQKCDKCEEEHSLIERLCFPHKEPPYDEENTSNIVLKSWFKGVSGVNYFAHTDLAISGCDASLCVVHKGGFTQRELKHIKEDGTEFTEIIRLPIVVVDLWVSISAGKGREIDLSIFRNTLIEMKEKRGFSLKLVTFDRFQSADSIQQLKNRGIEADILSVDRDTAAYDTVKDVMYTNRLRGYYRKNGINEFRQLVAVGNKIDHPQSGSKDDSDTLAGAVYNCIEAGGADIGAQDFNVDGPYSEMFGGDGSIREDIRIAYEQQHRGNWPF